GRMTWRRTRRGTGSPPADATGLHRDPVTRPTRVKSVRAHEGARIESGTSWRQCQTRNEGFQGGRPPPRRPRRTRSTSPHSRSSGRLGLMRTKRKHAPRRNRMHGAATLAFLAILPTTLLACTTGEAHESAWTYCQATGTVDHPSEDVLLQFA